MRAMRLAIIGEREATWQRPLPGVVPLEGQLRPKVLRGVHTRTVAPGGSFATAESAPAQSCNAEPPRSEARRIARLASAAMFVEWMALAAVSSSEVAAALDVAPQRVREMRTGQRPVTLECVLLMYGRLPAMRAVLLSAFEARVRGGNPR